MGQKKSCSRAGNNFSPHVRTSSVHHDGFHPKSIGNCTILLSIQIGVRSGHDTQQGTCHAGPTRHGLPWACSGQKLVTQALADRSACHLDPIRRLLGNHDRRHVGVAAHDARHDRGMDPAQTWHTVHSPLSVHHRHVVLAHAAGAHGVVHRVGDFSNPVFPLFVGPRICRRCLLFAVRRQCGLDQNFLGLANPVAQALQVTRAAQKLRGNQRRTDRVAVGQLHTASAVGCRLSACKVCQAPLGKTRIKSVCPGASTTSTTSGWSCRFSSTPGKSRSTLMPKLYKCAAGAFASELQGAI